MAEIETEATSAGETQSLRSSQGRAGLRAKAKNVTRETGSSAERAGRTEAGTKMRPAGPKSMEDDQRLTGKTEDIDRKGNHVSGGKRLPGRPTVSETKPESTNLKMKTFNKEQAKENQAGSTLGGPQSVRGDRKDLHRPKPSVRESSDPQERGGDPQERGGDPQEKGGDPQEKGGDPQEKGGDPQERGRDPQEEGSFRGGKDMLEAMFKKKEDGREILAKELKNVERGRRPGGGNIRHGDHSNNVRGGIEALEDHTGSTMGKVDNLAKEAKNAGKSRGFTPDNNQTPRRSNRGAVDKAGRRQEEGSSFRGGTEVVAIESEEEETKTTDNTNLTEEGPEIVPEVLRSAGSRDLTCKKTPSRCPTRPAKKDELCTSGRADHPPRPVRPIPRPVRPIPRPARPIPRPARPIPRPACPIWTGIKTVSVVLLFCGQFAITVSAGSLPDRSGGQRLYQFCVTSANLTDDHLMFREESMMHTVCEFQSGVSSGSDSKYTVSLHNETCAHMQTPDPEPVNYIMEYSHGKTCRSVPLDSSKGSESSLKINHSNNQSNVTEDASPLWAIILGVLAAPILLPLIAWGIYACWKKTYVPVGTDITPGDTDVERNVLQSTSGDEDDASGHGNANGVRTSSV